ncbi:alpha/beta hydrolase [Saccharolobus solfataricus]|uniref:Esterase, tropinesterase related protein n=2 Tax=Saccharolobus solfataricus TaxID=2287 RepID=Q7LXY9_SACS2|nr:Esterase, tropinesterase related protein [Saccharolobus solfataricus P2]AKA73443.2 alpha/beta hydrolase [Saccharolobus solfataricus]AKA76141.2 alpha/beta hydrolase [Saccharolobus solfataricus]AKA78833.2 alpha/beta hydrolase [Saccharolobus solfataricus]AZF67908.1 alpha/beta hydrolase [Saccharolobus solfataricus]
MLIHHLAGSYKSWKFVIPKLSLDNTVVAYDLRGHGRSSTPNSPYNIEDHSNDLRRLLVQLGIEKPVLIGHSIGSLIAIDYALKYPIEKLVLIGALYRAPSSEVYEKYVRIAVNFGMRALAEYRRFHKEFTETLASNYQAWNSLLEVYEETTPIGYKNAVEGLLKAKDYSDELMGINAKTLIVYGTYDGLIVNLNVFKNNMKNVEIKTIDGYGHFLNFENPLLLSEIIKNFL